MITFTRYTLRTSNVEAARGFYDAILGRGRADIVELHEQARKRGAVPHWLGTVTVDDVDRIAEGIAGRGGERLGPTVEARGVSFATLRDPGGALIGLSSAPGEGMSEVAWHVLNSRDVEASAEAYETAFGWMLTDSMSLDGVGTIRHFAWARGGANVGSMAGILGRPGVHPHWLFQMRVADLDVAVDTARTRGATFSATFVLPSGERAVVGDDPQGAAFSLRGV